MIVAPTIAVFSAALLSAPATLADPELRATAHSLPGVVIPKMPTLSSGTNQNIFSLDTLQSKFNLGTSRSQSSAKSAVGIKVDRDNPAIMTIVGHNEADIQKLLAKRYHRVVIPIKPFSPPPGPMQQVLKQQEISGQAVAQQVVSQQNIVAQTPLFQSNWHGNVMDIPIETFGRLFNILAPNSKSTAAELSAQAKPLKPFGQPTYIRWDSWYKRLQAIAEWRWQTYNNQLNTEVTAHVTVTSTGTLAVTGADVNLWKSAHPWDGRFNESAKQAVLEVLNSLKGSPLLKFPAHSRRSEVSFDLVFTTGGRAGVGINAPIYDVETVYGL